MDDQKAAASSLKSAEKSASEEIPGQNEDSIDGALEGEEEAKGFYSGKNDLTGKSKKKDKKGFSLKKVAKKKGPLGLIIGLILGGGGMMMGMQTMLPVAIEELIIEKLNSIGVSSTAASDSWLDMQLSYGIRENDLQNGNYSYSDSELYALSSWQVQSFERAGFKVFEVEANSDNVAVLLFDDNVYNTWVPVIGSAHYNKEGYSGEVLLDLIKEKTGYNNVSMPVTATEAFKNDRFKIAYTGASKTWRGGNSGWFDNMMEKVTSVKLSVNRNRWARFINSGMKNIDNGFKKLAKKADGSLDAGLSSVDQNHDDETSRQLDETDDFQWDPDSDETIEVPTEDGGTAEIRLKEDTEMTLIPETEGGSPTTDVGGPTKVTDASTLEKALSSKALKAASAVTSSLSVGCSIVEGIMSIYTVVSAYEAVQQLNLITGMLESSSKGKAGKGSQSPIHEYGDILTTRANTKNRYTNSTVDGRENMTAMESAGMSWLFSGVPISNSDASVQNINFQAIMSNASSIMDDVVMTASMFESCGYVKAIDGFLQVGMGVLSLIPAVGKTVKITQVITKLATKVALTLATASIINTFVPKIVSGIVDLLVQDVATEWLGEDYGNVAIAAANRYLGGNGTSGGQSPGSKSYVSSYLALRDSVIADEAKYQRAIRSPFDVTSQYTFLGSMVYSLMPLAFSGGGIMSSLRQVSSLTASAISGLLPSVAASSKEVLLDSNGEGNCNLLTAVGIMGDAFCNPYIITDTSTINTSPVAISEMVHNMNGDSTLASTGDVVAVNEGGNFMDNGRIDSESELAKYIMYCGERTSPYGVRDGNIAAKITGDSGDSLLNYMPDAEDLFSALGAVKEQANMDWISGRACAASEKNERWESEIKYYQRYDENMRLISDMNPGYETGVDALLEDDYKKNPVDDSFEGTLARFSGMTKGKVEDTLALIEYYEYIANYDGSKRLAFGDDGVDEPVENYFINENVLAENYFVLTNPIIYADVRNRQTMAI